MILTNIQFVDTFEIKKRPAVVLYEELDNIVVAGITSNKRMKGIQITESEGALKKSVIKMNYIFTVSRSISTSRVWSVVSQVHKLSSISLTCLLS